MAAPTTAACVKKTLANPEPSTHGLRRTTYSLAKRLLRVIKRSRLKLLRSSILPPNSAWAPKVEGLLSHPGRPR